MSAQSIPKKPIKTPRPKVPREEEFAEARVKFKSFLLGNPNYFGNLPDIGFEPVFPITTNTTYEQLECIGLHPTAEQLEAVVNIKRHNGYNGDACTDGSTEYVRFFVERAGVWHDLGVASVQVYDTGVASPLPLSYSVAMSLDEVRKYCTTENLVHVRGILSWNWEPPAGNENWNPPWGNVVDVTVQIAPWYLPILTLSDLIKDGVLELKGDVLKDVDLNQTLEVAPAQALSYTKLKEKYGDEVPGHRFGFTEAQALLKGPLTRDLFEGIGKPTAKAAPFLSEISSLSAIPIGAELAAVLAGLAETKGNTTYEELECAGYNPQTRTLAGVISVKQPSGYSGDLCDPGSTEYVGFWVFYGGAWHSLGTATVQVHDLAGASPANPVEYAVFRGVNVPEYLCEDIVGLPLRAILSWQTPPTGPGFDPVWGNVVDTNIQPIIGEPPGGDQRVRLMRINSVTVSGINAAGFANPTGVAGDCNTAVYGGPINTAPFAGPVYIEGDFTVKSDAFFNASNGQLLPGAKPVRYQVMVEGINPVSPPAQLTNPFNIAVFPVSPPPGVTNVVLTQNTLNIGGGVEAYPYMEGTVQAVNPRMLAVWNAGGEPEGLYRITVTGYTWNGVAYVPLATGPQTKDVYIFNGYPHMEFVVGGSLQPFQRPELHLAITSPGGDCGDFSVGTTISGTYSVTDNFFGAFDIAVTQIVVGGIPQPVNPVVPSTLKIFPAVGTHGTSGTWTLNTAGMTPCGYTIVLSSWDRALAGNSCSGHYNQVAVGFCLRED